MDDQNSDDEVPGFVLNNDPVLTNHLLEKIERQLGRAPSPRVAAAYRELALLVARGDQSGMLDEIIFGGETD